MYKWFSNWGSTFYKVGFCLYLAVFRASTVVQICLDVMFVAGIESGCPRLAIGDGLHQKHQPKRPDCPIDDGIHPCKEARKLGCLQLLCMVNPESVWLIGVLLHLFVFATYFLI